MSNQRNTQSKMQSNKRKTCNEDATGTGTGKKQRKKCRTVTHHECLVSERDRIKQLLKDADLKLDTQRQLLPTNNYQITGVESIGEMCSNKPKQFSHNVRVRTIQHDKAIADKMHFTHTPRYGQLHCTREQLRKAFGVFFTNDSGTYRKYDYRGKETFANVRNTFVVGFQSCDGRPYDVTVPSSYVEIFDDKQVDMSNFGRKNVPVEEVKTWAVSGCCSDKQFKLFMKCLCGILECRGEYKARGDASGIVCHWGIEISDTKCVNQYWCVPDWKNIP